MNAKRKTKAQKAALSRALKLAWKKRRLKKSAHRVDISSVPPSAELDNLRVQIERALQLIHAGCNDINEGWDIINSIPKRVT